MSLAQDAAGAPAPRPARGGLLHRPSFGALAVSGASAIRLGAQLALLPILARLVGPSEYGLVAMAMPFVLLANVLADGGLVVALGRRREASPLLESSAFWVAAGIGAALAVLTCASAIPIGLAMGEARLPALIMALSPILLMNSLTVVANGRIIRERRFAVFAGGDLISTLAGAATAVIAAMHGWGAWSLIAQQLVLWVCKLAWITLRAGVHIRPVFQFSAVRDVLAFGAKNLGSTLADYASRNLDNMIIGAVLGATTLGYYAMAYQVIRIPDMLISGPFYFYIFTAVSRATHEGDRETILKLAQAGLRLGAVALAPLFCGLAIVADLAVRLLLGPNWSGAIDALRLLAGAGLGFCICSIMAAMLNGLGRAGLQFKLALLLGLTTVLSVGASVRFGLAMVSGALACGVALVSVYYLDQLARDLRTSRLRLAGALAPAALGCAVLTAAALAARLALADASIAIQFAGCVAAGAIAYAAVIWLVARGKLLSDARAFARAHADAAGQAEAAESGSEAGRLASPDT